MWFGYRYPRLSGTLAALAALIAVSVKMKGWVVLFVVASAVSVLMFWSAAHPRSD